MRVDDPQKFAAYNEAPSREPNFVVAIEYEDETIAFTSAENVKRLPGRPVRGVLTKVSQQSQKVFPLEGRAEIGGFNVELFENVWPDPHYVYNFRDDSFWRTDMYLNSKQKTRMSIKTIIVDFSDGHCLLSPNGILRIYVSNVGQIRIYDAVAPGFVNTGLYLAAGLYPNEIALEWDGVGSYEVELNGAVYEGTYTPSSTSDRLNVGGNSSERLQGFLWDLHIWENDVLTGHFPMQEGSGDIYNYITGEYATLALYGASPQDPGSWWNASAAQRFSAHVYTQLKGDPDASPINYGKTLRDRRVNVYVGFTNDFRDYQQVGTGFCDSVSFKNGVYKLNCTSAIKQVRQTIFKPKQTRLSSNLAATGLAALNVLDTSEFERVTHTAAFTDAPSATVGYVLIEDSGEIIRWTSKTANTFTIDQRECFGTTAAAVTVSGSDTDSWPAVTEFFYLEMPAVQMAYALYTGVIWGSGSPPDVLPSHWHAGLLESLVDIEDFQNIGEDLYASDTEGFILRFLYVKPTDAKRFIETQIFVLCGVYAHVKPNGNIGLRRINETISGATSVITLTPESIVSHSDLRHVQKDAINSIRVDWNYDGETYTRTNFYVDAESIARNGVIPTKTFQFLGLYDGIHSIDKIGSLMQRYLDRFRDPPMEIKLDLIPTLNKLEPNDLAKVKINYANSLVVDYVNAGLGLNRTFEVQQVSTDWATGRVSAFMFASSRDAAVPQPIGTSGGTLADAFYTSKGTNIAGLAGVSGGAVTANLTLTGTSDMNAAGSVFYMDGPLTINAGVNLNIVGNVQLRIKGALQINGTINGVGNGKAGLVDPRVVGTFLYPADGDSYPYAVAGSQSYIGDTRANAGAQQGDGANAVSLFIPAPVSEGKHQTFPTLSLSIGDQAASPVPPDISGIPTDMRGGGGGYGESLYLYKFTLPEPPTYAFDLYYRIDQKGGNGGDGGAGLCIITRGGVAFGLNGLIDLSGDTGSDGLLKANWWTQLSTIATPIDWYSGGGAGGGPGALLVLLDGSDVPPPIYDGKFVAKTGACPQSGNAYNALSSDSVITASTGPNWLEPRASWNYYPATDEVDYSDSNTKYQFIPDYVG